MSPTEQVRQAILDAMNAIEEAFEQEQLPPSGPMSRSQLRQFQETLRRMLRDVDKPESITLESPTEGMGRVIIDSWPFRSLLGEVILKAEQEYLDLMSMRSSSLN